LPGIEVRLENASFRRPGRDPATMVPGLSTAATMLHLAAAAASPRSVVHLRSGLGSLRCEDIGSHSRQCLGVPFAEPPVGPLRWKPPNPAQGWSGVRDATSARPPPPICLQSNKKSTPGVQQEDCLYLNIFAPREAPPAGSAGYPVSKWPTFFANQHGGVDGCRGVRQ
jgi:para-nitrobenzyl esterase